MPDYPLYPTSRVDAFDAAEQYEVTAEVIAEIAEEARQAFFAVVASRLVDLYPGSTTFGDETPGEMIARDRIAVEWVERHAWNNTAVQEYNEEACLFVTSEVYEPAGLMTDWPDGITSVDIARTPETFPGLTATVRGSRRAIYDYILTTWDGTDDLDEWADRIVADEGSRS